MKNGLIKHVLWGCALLAACAPDIPVGVYRCETNADCPKHQVCEDDQFCWPRSTEPSENVEAGAAMQPCSAGTANCDANAANGCETKLLEDVQNCGGCGMRCEPIKDALASCEQGNCMEYEPSVGTPNTEMVHGGDGGSAPFKLQCQKNQVLVGAAFTVDKATSRLVGIEPRCAHLEFSKSPTGEPVADHEDAEPDTTKPDSSHKRTVRDCPPQTLVTSIRGTVETITLDDGQVVTAVTQLDLGFSKMKFGPQGQVTSEPLEPMQKPKDPKLFFEECPQGQAIVGLVGAADNLIGSVQMLCATILNYHKIEPDTATDN